MDHGLPAPLVRRVNAWGTLTRSERANLARALRAAGLSYGEMTSLVPVPKSTLAGWCRGIALTPDQVTAIKARTGPVAGIPRDTQYKRRAEIAAIEEAAAEQVPELMNEPLWSAGVALYWGEGSKSARRLELANSDPDALRVFMRWVERYLVASPEFVAAIHIHATNDETEARRFWAKALELSPSQFTKSYVKPDGTGHRKNHLAHGVCRVKVRRSTDAWITTMKWIDLLPGLLLKPSC